MLKTNKLKTLVMLLTTILGLTGITSTVYADKTSDKKIVSKMALTFVHYTTDTNIAALDWAEKNTTGKAYADPYRFGAPKKSRLVAKANETEKGFSIPSENNPNDFLKLNLKSINVNKDTAIIVIKRYVKEVLSKSAVNEYYFSHKIWFRKIEGKWKISNYYILRNNTKVNGKKQYISPANLSVVAHGDPLGFDSIGTKFPN